MQFNPLELLHRLQSQEVTEQVEEPEYRSDLHRKVSEILLAGLSQAGKEVPSQMGMVLGMLKGFLGTKLNSMTEEQLRKNVIAIIAMFTQALSEEGDNVIHDGGHPDEPRRAGNDIGENPDWEVNIGDGSDSKLAR